MANSVSIIGYGSDFQRSVDGGVTYATVGQLWEIGGLPSKSVTVIDHTNLLSPAATKEKRPGLKDPGEVEYKILFNKANYNTVFVDWANRSTWYWKLVFSDLVTTASTEAAQGFISKLGGEVPMDEKVLATVTITFTSTVTFTPGS